ncbi:MAG: geranylgeranyl reductase family protein [Acidimicrobiales bacterium]|nr:geranylgeranyl reductase family protein [Acidimicrobiales bacterium]
MFYDVVIVGGGPAGSSAACSMAKSGLSVLLIDKSEFPRDKCCGDGLTTMALRLSEELGLNIENLKNLEVVNEAVIHFPSGKREIFPLPKKGMFAAIVPRAEYDLALIDLARELMVDVRLGLKFSSINFDEEKTFLNIEGMGEVETSFVIAADGAWSPVRRSLDLGEEQSRGEWLAFRQYISGVASGSNDLHVWFEKDLLPGYAWSFPLPNGKANVGFGVLKSQHSSASETAQLARELFSRKSISETLGSDIKLEGRQTAWPIPARINSQQLTNRSVIFVGDAAASTDILTGEGIGQALLTGILAGEAIKSGGNQKTVTSLYEKSVKGHLLADHRMSVALQKVLAHPAGAENALRLASLNQWSRRNFARWMFEDYPRALLFTPKRWKKGVFDSEGAYNRKLDL